MKIKPAIKRSVVNITYPITKLFYRIAKLVYRIIYGKNSPSYQAFPPPPSSRLQQRHLLYTHIFNPKFYNPDTKKYESLKNEFSKKRKHGISGYLRVFNEEETIENAILSCIDSLDELVICLNNCFDNTEEIVKRLLNKYPDKIKLYWYNYDMHPVRSERHAQSKYNDVKNLANLNNYTLSKCSFKYAVKVDADNLMIKRDFEEICKSIRRDGLNKYLYFKGLNLYEFNNKIYFLGKTLMSGDGDIGFYKITKYTYYLHNPLFEEFNHTLPEEQIKEILFFHLKCIKSDKGLLNRSLNRKKLVFTKEQEKLYAFFLGKRSSDEMQLLTFSQLVKVKPEFKDLALPEEYAIEI